MSCEDWFAVEEGDGQIERLIHVENPDEAKKFSHLFTTKSAKGFSEEHIWLSVLLKPPHSMFTRVRRLTCCLCLLMTTMLTSAMFFSFDNKSIGYTLHIGSLSINYKGIIVGIQSGFISIPINAIIVYLFQNARTNKLEPTSLDLENHSSNADVKTVRGKAAVSSVSSFEQNDSQEKLIKESKTRSPVRRNLPHVFIYLAWFLCFATVTSSFAVVLFYSMVWGNDKSVQWLISISTGFIQSVFIVQPIKLIAVALLVAMILKTPEEDGDILESYKSAAQYDTGNLQMDKKLLDTYVQDIEEHIKYVVKKLDMINPASSF